MAPKVNLLSYLTAAPAKSARGASDTFVVGGTFTTKEGLVGKYLRIDEPKVFGDATVTRYLMEWERTGRKVEMVRITRPNSAPDALSWASVCIHAAVYHALEG